MYNLVKANLKKINISQASNYSLNAQQKGEVCKVLPLSNFSSIGDTPAPTLPSPKLITFFSDQGSN